MQATESYVNFVEGARYLDIFYIVSLSLLYWDHFLTFDDEVKYVWRSSFSWSSFWFFLNRYFAFFGNIPVIVIAFSYSLPTSICNQYHLYHQLLILFTQCIVCVILTLRVYALYNCDRRILFVLVVSGLVIAGIGSWALLDQRAFAIENVPGCHSGTAQETAIRIATAWEVLVLYDTLVFVATMVKTCRDRNNGFSDGLLQLIFRDGAMYFGIMMAVNLGNLLTFYLSTLSVMRGGLSTFASSVSVTLCSRLLLHLHERVNNDILEDEEDMESFINRRIEAGLAV